MATLIDIVYIYNTIDNMKHFIAGILVGIGILFGISKVNADIFKVLKPIYDKNPKITLQDLAQYTSDQFEYTYGRLDYMVRQLNILQNTCATSK